jgi:hypothetical protein
LFFFGISSQAKTNLPSETNLGFKSAEQLSSFDGKKIEVKNLSLLSL